MKNEVREVKGTWLLGDFTINHSTKIPETGEEAVEMLGVDTADKLLISKAITNQYDKARNKEKARLEKENRPAITKLNKLAANPEKLARLLAAMQDED